MKVFYDKRQSVFRNISMSPSAEKPANLGVSTSICYALKKIDSDCFTND